MSEPEPLSDMETADLEYLIDGLDVLAFVRLRAVVAERWERETAGFAEAYGQKGVTEEQETIDALRRTIEEQRQEMSQPRKELTDAKGVGAA